MEGRQQQQQQQQAAAAAGHSSSAQGQWMQVATIGFPHLGGKRELKHLLEGFWEGKLSEGDVRKGAHALEAEIWGVQASAGVDFIGVGDFALYDWCLNWIEYLGCVPKRFHHLPPGSLTRHLAMARGGAHPVEERGLELRKWFNTNYHYLVPEFEPWMASAAGASSSSSGVGGQQEEGAAERRDPGGLQPDFRPLLESLAAARDQLGPARAVPMLLGPLTFLWLGHLRPSKSSKAPTAPSPRQREEGKAGQEQEQAMQMEGEGQQEAAASFEGMLGALMPLYKALLQAIAALGFPEVQLHEPALVTEHGHALLIPSFQQAYPELLAAAKGTNLGVDLVTYFDEMHEEVLRAVTALPFAAASLDFTHGGYPALLENNGFPLYMRLGLGALDGRSVWKPDPPLALPDMVLLQQAVKNVRLQPSCSLQFLPWSLQGEEEKITAAHPLVWPLLSFATEKLGDLRTLAEAAVGQDPKALEEWKWTRLQRDTSYEAPVLRSGQPVTQQAAAARARARALQSADFERSLTYDERARGQVCRKLPAFPCTVVGSLAGTGRYADPRAPGAEGEYARAEIERAIRLQEAAGVDILAHGAYDRADMVEVLASKLQGMLTTEHGWVRAFGSRCVRPPIIVGDIWRPAPLTVDGFKHAQSLTTKVVKGQLPGPMTLLQWSFPLADRPFKEQALQIALCLRDEVRDLEIAGAKVIEVDELGFREGLPLRGQKRHDYLQFTAEAFRLATSIAGPHIELHTHVSLTEVEDCLLTMLRFEADVYLFENARSRNEALQALQAAQFPRLIGLGCFDVHNPTPPTVEEVLARLRAYAEVFSPEQLVVVPDGPLRTRSWEEVQEALSHMCEAAKMLRNEVEQSRRPRVASLGGSGSGGVDSSGGWSPAVSPR